MPVHVYWGDDTTALEHAVAALAQKVLDPAWEGFNLQHLDGQKGDAATLALTTVRMGPFWQWWAVGACGQQPLL